MIDLSKAVAGSVPYLSALTVFALVGTVCITLSAGRWGEMMTKGFIAGGALSAVLGLAACATAPAPANAPPPLPVAEQMGDSEVPYSAVITVVGKPTISAGPVARGGTVLSFGYLYRHTAVLTEDVTGFSITVPGVQAPKGAPGYYAGTFVSTGTYAAGGLSELWCFLPAVVGGKRESLCLLKNQPGVAAIAPTRMNPWLWTQFAPATGSFDYVRTPIYERRAVEIPGNLTMDYLFAGWTRSGIRLEIRAVGREVETVEVLRAPGAASARLRTVAGDFDLGFDPANPDQVVATAL